MNSNSETETNRSQIGGVLTGFLRDMHSAKLPGDGDWHGFRVDANNTSLLFRVKPSPGDYDIYCWAYKKDWLDDHMLNTEKGIRFIESKCKYYWFKHLCKF